MQLTRRIEYRVYGIRMIKEKKPGAKFRLTAKSCHDLIVLPVRIGHLNCGTAGISAAVVELPHVLKLARSAKAIIYHGNYQRSHGCLGAASRYIYIDSTGRVHACPFCQDSC